MHTLLLSLFLIQPVVISPTYLLSVIHVSYYIGSIVGVLRNHLIYTQIYVEGI